MVRSASFHLFLSSLLEETEKGSEEEADLSPIRCSVSIPTCRTGYYITGLADPDPDACVPCPQQGACENYTGRMTTCTQPGVEFLLVEAGLCFNGCPAARTPWDCQPKIDDPTDLCVFFLLAF